MYQRIYYGLIPAYGTYADFPLVASDVHYRVVDVQYHATLVQTYTSQTSRETEVRYTFPLPSDAAVCSYKAVIDGSRTIVGVVKGKQEATQEYNAAVQQGYTAALLEQANIEVFQISLGNIRNGQTIEVHTSFVALISQDGGLDALRLTFPTAIGPRYGDSPVPTVSNINSGWRHRFNGAQKAGLNLSVSFEMSSPIRGVKSPSHPISTNLGTNHANSENTDFDPSKAFVTLSSTDWLTDDIVVVVQCAELDRPRCMVETYTKEEGAEELTDAYALTLVPRFELPPLPKQEFIFLVDRSGSMQGGKMEAVRASLQIMLKSLPTRNTLFNIYSFGSWTDSLWPTSHPYTAQSVEAASSHIDKMSANYRGTDMQIAINAALKGCHAYRQEHIQKKTVAGEDQVPTSVFVLTDGESWDLEGVQTSIREAVGETKAKGGLLRVFTLGIGDAVSRAMCDGIARVGLGVSVFVKENEKPDQKLMGLVRAARGAPIENLSVDWGTNVSEPSMDASAHGEDDFEMVDSDTATLVSVPEPAKEEPLSLFDTSYNPVKADKKVDVGIKDIKLPVPPALQVAPAVDKLPSLYPGFRASIFAIHTRSSSSSLSTQAKINGTILGRVVSLVVPIVPTSQQNELFVEDFDNTEDDLGANTKMLHLLAARALIQKFEDAAGEGTQHRKMTEVDEAEVKRLALRYRLASSQTSFVAVDTESKISGQAVIRQEGVAGSGYQNWSVRKPMAVGVVLNGTRGRGGFGSFTPPKPMIVRTAGGSGSRTLSSRMKSSAAPPTPGSGGAYMSVRSASTFDGFAPSSFMPFGDAPPAPAGIPAPAPASRTRSMRGSARPAAEARQAVQMASPIMSAAAPTQSQVQVQPIVTVESFARLQAFDGSFGHDSWMDGTVWKGSMPAPTRSLSAASLNASVLPIVWRTIICVAHLQVKFREERDAWELMVEKALDFVRDSGVSVDVDAVLVEARKMIV